MATAIQEALVEAGLADEVERDESPSVRVEFTRRDDSDVYLELAGYELPQECVVIELEE